MSQEIERDLLLELIELVARWTGFQRASVVPSAIERALAQKAAAGTAPSAFLESARRGDPEAVATLFRAASVGETYFFRHPEQFQAVAGWAKQRAWQGDDVARAWSAGCATGEEAYSLAACLFESLPPGASLEVLGTDLVAHNVEVARKARYGRWSVRDSGPELYRAFSHRGQDYRVHEEVRRRTRFEVRNLLEAPPGQFDLIFCRNVLVYFSAEAVDRVLELLSSALKDGGLIALGAMDLQRPPENLVPVGRPELQLYARPGTDIRLDRETPPVKLARLPMSPVQAPPARQAARRRPDSPRHHAPQAVRPSPVDRHVRALGLIERGDLGGAERALEELCREEPRYLPALLERALMLARLGRTGVAVSLMHEVLRRSEELSSQEVVSGPEPLPASFYVHSARAFLSSRVGGAR